jgi:chemotaxis protein methyltransferase CheR
MLTVEEFSLFRSLIYQESGMYFADGKREFLDYRIRKRMQATATATPYWYYRFVAEHRAAELPALLESVTINETSFFRNPPQIELLRRQVLPGLLTRKGQASERRLRIWSAGCSTGEEPYTLAIAALELLEGACGWELQIFASDLSQRAMEQAERARYPAAKVRETVPAEILSKYFDPVGEDYQVKDRVRRQVSFDIRNLKHESGLTDIDVIFCRNVMIYFDDEERRRVVDRFHRSLNPGGFLFLGHAESLHGLDDRFEFVFADKGTAYQKPGGAEP